MIESQVDRISALLRSVSIIFIVATLSLSAQPQPVTGDPGSSGGSKSLFGTVEPGKVAGDLGEVAPIERSVNPTSYRLGPNDQLLLAIPTLESDGAGQIPLLVSLDNTILLPRGLGLIDVSKMTLADLRRSVDSLFRTRGGRALQNASITLVRPRAIYVTVSGDVMSPGPYILSAADRVTTTLVAVSRLPENLPDKQKGELEKQQLMDNQRRGGSSVAEPILGAGRPIRRVIIRHNDGTISEADLVRYRAFGADADNPTLREGDEIIVRQSLPSDATIGIAGAVNSTVTIEHKKGDNALLLLKLAGGLRDDADIAGAYISRVSSTGSGQVGIDILDTAALAGVQLQPGDQIVIPSGGARGGASARAGVVSVKGEVYAPSAYPIVNGETKLSEVIRMAGGVTPYASLAGAHINRADDPSQYRTKPLLADPIAGMANSSLTLEDSTRFKFDNELQQNRVSTDFIELIARGNSSKDVVLQNGDEIVIPRDPGAVMVYGRVGHPGWVAYKEGVENEYYIFAAGGYTTPANPGRVIVEKFGTGVWEDICCTTVNSGDKIYVPGDRDTPARTSLEIAGTIIGITSGVLLIANTVISIINALKPNE